MFSSSSISTLEHLQQLFPGVLALNSHQTASVLNIPFKTLSNAGEDFPIPNFKIGPRKFYRLVDIAAYIDGRLGIKNFPAATVIPASPQRRGRGRPAKVARALGGA